MSFFFFPNFFVKALWRGIWFWWVCVKPNFRMAAAGFWLAYHNSLAEQFKEFQQ